MLGIATTNAAKGTINSDQQSFTIQANDQLTKAEEYNDVILAYRNGAPIRVRDVGQAVAGPQDVNVAAYARPVADRDPAGLQAARRQRHRHRRSHQGGDAAALLSAFRRA